MPRTRAPIAGMRNGVRVALGAERASGTMATDERQIVTEWQELGLDGPYQGRVIAAGKNCRPEHLSRKEFYLNAKFNGLLRPELVTWAFIVR
jgi:hypothetical protein